jgi:hypothetical protein
MRSLLLTIAAFVVGVVPVAADATADAWSAALRRGAYAEAATLLQRAVFEPAPNAHGPDAAALKQLAELYADGKGVDRDGVLACGLARAHAIAAGRTARGVAATRTAQALVERHCHPLGAADRAAAFAAMSCPRIGLARHAPIALEAGWSIQFNDRSATIVRGGQTREQALPGDLVCRSQVLLTRHSAIDASDKPRTTPESPKGLRHVVEQVTVQSAWRAGTLTREIVWQLYEVRGLELDLAAVQRWQEPGSAWPAPPLPEAIARGVTFSARGADIDYAIGDVQPRYGRIEARKQR